ncbi:MAG: sensor histidine kinase [Candidatus Chloroheliales bacterium]|nr:MAG: sensor histidine kinase [Chloroflexota bacterium]
MSIRLRLVLLYSGFLAVIVTVLCLAVYGFFAKNLSDSVDDTLRSRIQAVVQSSTLRDVYGTLQVDVPAADAFSSESVYVEVLDLEGRIARVSSNLAGNLLPISDSAFNAAAHQGKETWSNQTLPNGTVLRMLTSPLQLPRVAEPSGAIIVAESLEPMKATLRSLALVLIISGVAAVLLSVLLGWFVTRRALTPIAAVTATAHNIELSQDLSQRIPERKVNDEVGQLANTFNRMLDRLQTAFAFQQRFVADSSHELRTPLTVIKGNASLLRHVDDPAERDEALRAIENEANRMSRIVDDLLLLAQLDNPSPTAVQDSGRLKRPVELDTLLLDTFKQARVMAGSRRVSFGHEDTATVLGDPDQLKQLLLNLVDNAVKYTPEEGSITLSLYRDNGWAVLEVADTGVGISQQDLPHIWERFYRVDKVRSREAGGTGLGLPIVRSIAFAHGGSVAAYSEPGQGSIFRVWLPLAAALNPEPLPSMLTPGQPLDGDGATAAEYEDSTHPYPSSVPLAHADMRGSQYGADN